MKSKFVINKIVPVFPWIIIALSAMLIFASFVIYQQRINIYGDLKIYVTIDNVSVDSNTDCYGFSIFGRKKSLVNDEGYFHSPEDWYFDRIEIDLKQIESKESINIKIKDQNEQLVLDTIVEKNRLVVINHLNYGHGVFQKLKNIGFGKSSSIKSLFSLLLIWIFIIYVMSAVTIFTYSFLLRWNKSKKPVKIFGVIGLGFLLLFVYQFAYFDKLFLWTGFYLQIAICIFFILLVDRFVNSRIRNKQNLMTVLISVFVGLLIVEASLRILGINVTAFEQRFGYYESVQTQFKLKEYFVRDSNISYILKNEEFEFERQSNSLGLSGDEPEIKKADNEFLIMALGDSFTEGDGAHKDSTWLKFLERKLPDNDSVDYYFFNAGVCGSDPIYEYKLLKDKLLVYKPDLVIVSYGFELTDVITRGGKERYQTKKPAIERYWWQPLYSVSFLTRLIVHNLCGYNDLLLSKADYENAKQKAISDLKISIDDFKKLSESDGFELLIIFFPMQNELDSGKYNSNMELIEYSNKLGIRTLDMMKYYRQELHIDKKTSSNYYWEKDGHHNSSGYEKYADGVLWKFQQSDIKVYKP